MGGRTKAFWMRMAGLAGLAFVAACGDRDREAEAPVTEATTGAVRTAAATVESPTLAAIKRRGRLNCGVNQGLVGFAFTDNRGQWRGFDVDFCRGLAAAIFGDPDAVRFVPLTAENRLQALTDGRIDVLWRNTSWTMERDTSGQHAFAGVNYYDGQGFLVRRALDLNSASELTGARVCVQAGSTSALNAEDYFRSRGVDYRAVVQPTEEAARQAYGREDCDAFSADVSALAAARTTLEVASWSGW